MKKYLFLFLILLATPASAGFESVIQYYNAAGGGAGCSNVLMDSPTVNQSNNEILGTIGEECVATTLVNNQGESYTLDAITVHMEINTGSPTGNVTAYIYTADNSGSPGVPDDRIAAADATVDASTIDGDCSATPDEITFDFTGVTLPNSSEYVLVICFDGDDGNYLSVCRDTYIEGDFAIYGRSGLPPGETNDAASWTTLNSDGVLYYETYECQ